jgi:hypothetical protein
MQGSTMKSVIRLDSRASHHAIESAIRTHAQVVIESAALPGVTINGFLISGDEKALLMEITGRPAVNLDHLPGARCEVQLYGEQRFLFTANVTGAPAWGESRAVALTRPDSLRVLDRRRFIRAKLAPSSRVTIDWHRNGEGHQQVAALLNISVDGLACRVDGAAAAAIDAAQSPCRVRFDLPRSTHRFDLPATVCSRTPASAGCVILGLQFIVSGAAAAHLSALREALAGDAPAARPREALA